MTEYMWVKTEGGIATVGITDEARTQLGNIVYVDLPNVGAAVEQDKAMGTVESVQAVRALISPVSGTVIQVNDDPEGKSWLLRVKLFGS
jgi:glycine cleavage system H protein